MSSTRNLETTSSIALWAESAFGPAPSDARLIARANEEMAELLDAVANARFPDYPIEAADVTIVLCRYGQKLGIDVKAAADSTRDADPTNLLFRVAIDVNAAMSKLLRAVTADASYVVKAAALIDLVAMLADFCRLCGVELWDAVEDKMVVNHTRHWRQDGTGHGYHVRDVMTTEQQAH